MGAVVRMDDHAAIDRKDRGAGGGGDGDRQAARAAAFQHRMETAAQQRPPIRGQTGGGKTREIRKVRPASSRRGPISEGRLG